MRLKILFLLAVGFFAFALFFHQSFEMNQDLGRHLLTGKIILETGSVPKVNLFSYTYPDFGFINSHWLSEVIFFQMSQHFGLSSLVYLSTLVSGTAVVLTAVSMLLLSGSLWASILSVVILSPILLERTEVRPEMFSYLFAAFFLFITLSVLFKKKSFKLLYFLPLVELIWVNSHIYFILGPAILAIGLLLDRKFFWPLVLSIGAMLVNPNGLTGALYPLSVFQNYGYTIVENQNIFFLEPLIKNPNISYFKIGLVAFLISWIIRAKKAGNLLVFCLLMSVFIALPLLAIRSFPFFFLLLGPILAANLAGVKHKYINLVIILGIGLIIFRGFRLISNNYAYETGSDKKFGAQVMEQGKPGTDFILKNNLSGPIFNNFDIGSYLDYRLYPKLKVFVDGRPEAYPGDFFQRLYIPMQSTSDNFKIANDKYNFNLIVFTHTDATPWGRQFLSDIIKNPGFKLVFLDDFTVIFVPKDNPLPALDLKNFQMPTAYPANIANILELFGYEQQAQRYILQVTRENPNKISKSSLILF